MKLPLYLFCSLLFCQCTMPEEKAAPVARQPDTALHVMDNHEAEAAPEPELEQPLPQAKLTAAPKGIYTVTLPISGGIQQIIAFSSNHNFQLQEKYISAKKDSVVVTSGNWMPSDGFIWLYKDQIVRGRYAWKGDTLQYFSPMLAKKFSMKPMREALENNVLRNKEKEGIVFFATGTEPFWSVELNNADTIAFQLPDWTAPLQFKLQSATQNNDSLVYKALHDSTAIEVTVYPYFCTDGMSEYIYRHKIRVAYNKQVFSGCGLLYQ